MSRRIAALFGLLFLVFLVGLLVTYIQDARLQANRKASENNLRQLSLFAAHHVDPRSTGSEKKLPNEIPSATVVLAGVRPEERLSWIVPILPGFDQRRNNVVGILNLIDTQKPWSSPKNQEAARIPLSGVLCPENTPTFSPNDPAITCYVGITGLGADAASLTVSAQGQVSPRAGAFHYDGPTPFDRIADGLSQTLLIGETASDPGPWLRGGPSTARGLDDSSNAKSLIGPGGQFGGFFPGGGYFSMCDGSVRFISSQVSPSILKSLATIAGNENQIVPE
jgi:hypothetical protein